MVVNTEMDSMYLENLDEFINDEGKIVTYKWLSLTLEVPSNVAKQMLYQFVTEQRNKDNDSLNVTYLLSGIQDVEQGKVHKVMVVREENLEVVKRSLKELISVHVYSVAKSKLSDLSALYTADYDITKANITSITKHSGIECSTAKVRSADDLVKLQKQSAFTPQVQTSILPPKTRVSPKKEVNAKLAAAKVNSNQIANMFSKQPKKEDTKSGVKTEKTAAKPGKAAASSKNKGGISSFFTKGPAPAKTSKSESTKTTPKTESPQTDTDSPTIKTEVKDEIKNENKTEVKEEASDEMETDESPIVKSPVKTEIKKEIKKEPSPKKEIKKEFGNSKTKTKATKKRKTLSEDPMPKKRSRIMEISDSESSDGEQEESDEEAPMPPSPEPEKARIESESEDEVIPSTPQAETSDNRGKKKKLVDKTFMDEDGFLVTKKEWEYVDDSGDDAEVKAEETKAKQSPKKVEDKPKKAEPSPVKKNKQANIMSFFKKK